MSSVSLFFDDVTRYNPFLPVAFWTTYSTSNAHNNPCALPIWAGIFSIASSPFAPGAGTAMR